MSVSIANAKPSFFEPLSRRGPLAGARERTIFETTPTQGGNDTGIFKSKFIVNLLTVYDFGDQLPITSDRRLGGRNTVHKMWV